MGVMTGEDIQEGCAQACRPAEGRRRRQVEGRGSPSSGEIQIMTRLTSTRPAPTAGYFDDLPAFARPR